MTVSNNLAGIAGDGQGHISLKAMGLNDDGSAEYDWNGGMGVFMITNSSGTLLMDHHVSPDGMCADSTFYDGYGDAGSTGRNILAEHYASGSTRYGYHTAATDPGTSTLWFGFYGDSGFNCGFAADITATKQLISASAIDPRGLVNSGYDLLVYGSSSLDNGAITTDGSGNVTCLSLTQTSDANTKTNIAAVDPATVLQKLVSVPVYHWNFRDTTSTNHTATTNTRLTNSSSLSSSSSITNLIVSQHIRSNVTHFGPMAQDWSARFGGHTNGISVIDMQGLLLAGVQALAQQNGVFTNANGAKFHLIVNAATNGFVFVAE